jgi:hypothetical protein|tara:strand:+ start:45 stop:1277 length:1233 start_codon:yes stop_codon:yes gene_type:complete
MGISKLFLAPVKRFIQQYQGSLHDVLFAKAKQMELKPEDRVQPDLGGAGFLDRDYQTPAPGGVFPDLSLNYPRNPDVSAALPKDDRARVLVERRPEISEILAQKIRATGQMDEDTRFFYHTDGPMYRAAIEAGLTDAEAKKYLLDLSNNIAATSPRTVVETNLQNATLAMAKEAQGIPFREIIGPGTKTPTGEPGISEKGYPMMTGKGGIHGQLLDKYLTSGSIDASTNPKPATFGPNLGGNRSGVTVDTHAIRGTLMALNDLDPGAVPEGFIKPKYWEQYLDNPSVLTPNMIQDTLAKQMVGPKGERTSMQTEYPVFADIWHDAAEKLGTDPAETQSMGWFGFGEDTNLGSKPKTPVDVFDERLSVTAKVLEIPVDVAAQAVFRREIPLLGLGLGALPAFDEDPPEPGV